MIEEQNAGKSESRVLLGRLLAGIGLVFCVPVGAYFVSLAIEAVGILLGVAGYALGSRTLGTVTVAACVAAGLVGLLVGQGVIPGSYDLTVDGVYRFLQDTREGLFGTRGNDG